MTKTQTAACVDCKSTQAASNNIESYPEDQVKSNKIFSNKGLRTRKPLTL